MAHQTGYQSQIGQKFTTSSLIETPNSSIPNSIFSDLLVCVANLPDNLQILMSEFHMIDNELSSRYRLIHILRQQILQVIRSINDYDEHVFSKNTYYMSTAKQTHNHQNMSNILLEKLLNRFHQLLLQCQEFGDHKVKLTTQIIEFLSNKSRQLGLDAKIMEGRKLHIELDEDKIVGEFRQAVKSRPLRQNNLLTYNRTSSRRSNSLNPASRLANKQFQISSSDSLSKSISKDTSNKYNNRFSSITWNVEATEIDAYSFNEDQPINNSNSGSSVSHTKCKSSLRKPYEMLNDRRRLALDNDELLLKKTNIKDSPQKDSINSRSKRQLNYSIKSRNLATNNENILAYSSIKSKRFNRFVRQPSTNSKNTLSSNKNASANSKKLRFNQLLNKQRVNIRSAQKARLKQGHPTSKLNSQNRNELIKNNKNKICKQNLKTTFNQSDESSNEDSSPTKFQQHKLKNKTTEYDFQDDDNTNLDISNSAFVSYFSPRSNIRRKLHRQQYRKNTSIEKITADDEGDEDMDEDDDFENKVNNSKSSRFSNRQRNDTDDKDDSSDKNYDDDFDENEHEINSNETESINQEDHDDFDDAELKTINCAENQALNDNLLSAERQDEQESATFENIDNCEELDLRQSNDRNKSISLKATFNRRGKYSQNSTRHSSAIDNQYRDEPKVCYEDSNDNDNCDEHENELLRTSKNIVDERKESTGGDEEVYCTCRQVSYGNMIMCDNKLCNIEWFHFGCVNLIAKPKGKWYCPQCRGETHKVMRKVNITNI